MSDLRKLVLTGIIVLSCEAISLGDTLRVQVSDKETRAPVAASVIAVGTVPTVFSARTDQNGVATIDLPSLQHVSLSVRTETHGERCFGPEETKAGSLKVELEPSIRIHGVVRDDEGNPASMVSVKVMYTPEKDCGIKFESPGEFTNEQGEYVLRNVDLRKKFRIVFRHDDYLEHQVTKDELLGGYYGVPARKMEMDVNVRTRP